jgi:hypothetical protein
MTAANVAAAPRVGRSVGNGPVGAIALTIGLVAGIAVGSLALRPATAEGPQAVAPAAQSAVTVTGFDARVAAPATSGPGIHARVAATTPNLMANYSRLVASLKVAEESHDFASRYRFERQLDQMLTAPMIGAIYEARASLLERRAAATASGNDSLEAKLTRELIALCGPTLVKAELSFCN